MKLEKKIKAFVGFQIAYWIAKIFYIAGLTALIPLIPLVLSPNELDKARYAFGISIGSIVLGFCFIYFYAKSNKIAFRSLGFMTLIPGLLAVIFSYMGPRRMTILLRTLGDASPYLEKWVESYIPNAWLLAGIFIILGVALIWVSEKVRH